MDVIALQESIKLSHEVYFGCPEGFNDSSDHSTGTEVYWRADKTNRELVVAFRGTDTTSEYIFVDFKAFFWLVKPSKTPEYQKINKNIKTHPGIMQHYFNVRPFLLKLAKLYAGLGYRIRYTGHSLGALMAEYAALDAQYNYNANTSVYKFASPMGGNLAYKHSIEGRIINLFDIVAHGDPVPPWPSILLGYHSTGHRYYVGPERCIWSKNCHLTGYYLNNIGSIHYR